MDLNDLKWFLIVAQENSFTKASARARVSQSTLSRKIARLEESIGVQLVVRSTRSVALTDAGEQMRQLVSPHLDAIETDLNILRSLRDSPSGRIRITMPEHALRTVVWPKLRSVLREHPQIELELNAENGFEDIIEGGFDAGIRLGEALHLDMIAVRISPDWRLVAIAAPSYLERYGTPTHPEQLAEHNCITSATLHQAPFRPGASARMGRTSKSRSTAS